MSIRLPLLALGLFLLSFAATDPARAQAGVNVYIGPAYSTHVEDPGVAAGAYLSVAGLVQAGGDFTYYFVSDTADENLKIWTIDLNGRYPVLQGTTGGLQLFAIAGVNILRWSFDAPESPGFDFSTSGTDVGLNAGAVVEYDAGSIGLFGKAHAVIGGDSDGFVLGGGVFKKFGG